MDNQTFMREETGDQPPSEYEEVADRNDLAGIIDKHVIPGLLKTFVESDEIQVISLSNNSILDYGFPGWFADQMKANCVEGQVSEGNFSRKWMLIQLKISSLTWRAYSRAA